MRDVVAPPDFGQTLASLPPRDGLLPLMQSEFELPPEPNAPGLSTLPAFPGSGFNQFPLEFRQPAEDGQH